MPKLYVKEYSRALCGKKVLIACRKGILRDCFAEIVSDVRFLVRHGINTTLLHNMSNRFSNKDFFKRLKFSLPNTEIAGSSPGSDFYAFALDYKDKASKIIFLERECLTDHKGRKINSVNTLERGPGQIVINPNFKDLFEKICERIEAGSYGRAHVLPAGKNALKEELFSIEGSGTIIANDFRETFAEIVSEKEADIVFGLLDIYKREGFLKPRTKDYIVKKMKNFYATRIDGIIVGCVEKKHVDPETVELGALAISTRFRNRRVGIFTVNSFMEKMSSEGYENFISLTNNPDLEMLFPIATEPDPVEGDAKQRII